MLSIVHLSFYATRTTWQLFILRGAVFFRCGAQLLDVSGGVSKVEIRHRQLLVIVLPLAAQSNPVFISLTHSHPLRSGSASKFAANHPVKTNKSCKCLDSSPAAFQYQFSDNTYGFSFRCLASTFPNILISHELTTKKSPAFLQGSNGTNRVSAQFILIASHPRGGCQKPATRRFRMTLIDYSSAPGVKSNADSQTRITDMALYELGISPRLCIPCWCPRTGAMSAHCLSTASFYSQKILVQDVPLPTVLTFEI